MAGNSGLIRAHRTLTLAASRDTYSGTGSGTYYASGAVPTATFKYPDDRYLLADVTGLTRLNFSFNNSGTVTTPSITLYYTNDPATASGLLSQPGTGLWTIMSAFSLNTGAGTMTNPITAADGTQSFEFNGSLLAYRITTSGFAGGGSVVVNMEATLT